MEAVMTIGEGAIISISRKQGLSTRSRIAAILVVADDTMSSMLETRIFLKAQVCTGKKNALFQENKSLMLIGTERT
jgi:hypothetical protein